MLKKSYWTSSVILLGTMHSATDTKNTDGKTPGTGVGLNFRLNVIVLSMIEESYDSSSGRGE